MKKDYQYEIAISFANEDRNAAIALVLALKKVGFQKIYYYPKERADGWGMGLETQLTKIYYEKARYAIVLFSDHYFDEKKIYTRNIELNAIEMRMKSDSNVTYMLPVLLSENFNFKNYPTLEKRKYIPWNYDPEQIASNLLEKFGIKRPDSEPPEKLAINNTIIIKGGKAKKAKLTQAGGKVITNNYFTKNND